MKTFKDLLSDIAEKESDDEQTTVQEYNPETGENSKLGDILKEHLEK